MARRFACQSSLRTAPKGIGAGSIGQAIARRVGAGKHVLLADLNQQNADAAAKVLDNAGFEVSTATVDVSSRESVHALVTGLMLDCWKAPRLWTTSPIDTMPTSCPSSTTGIWPNFPASIWNFNSIEVPSLHAARIFRGARHSSSVESDDLAHRPSLA